MVRNDLFATLYIIVTWHSMFYIYTTKKKYRRDHGNNILDTPLVKHFNDLLERESSERSKDEVSYFYVGDIFCIHPRTKYVNFQEKIFAEISGKMFQTLCIT